MLLSDAICYALLTIIITATCGSGESTQAMRELAERESERRSKREAAVLVDDFSSISYKEKPDLIYKRLSRVRYRKPRPKHSPPKVTYGPPPTVEYGPPPKAEYGPPPKAKYGPPPKRHVKKYRRKQVQKSKFKKRAPKPSYESYHEVSFSRPPKAWRVPKAPEPYYVSEPAGFGEPPKDFTTQHVQPPKQSYGEPPVDSYGDPLKPNTPYSTAEPFDETTNFAQQYQSYQSYQQDLNVDNINAYSKNHPSFAKPEAGLFDEEMNQPNYVDLNLDSYADVYKETWQNDFSSELGKQRLKTKREELMKPSHNVYRNRPWKSKVKNVVKPHDDHIVVGGQYAEPPGRLVPNFQPSAPMDTGIDDFTPPHSYVDPKLATSASKSPYVNYKNSNMAFSPQNLNDAFSIY